MEAYKQIRKLRKKLRTIENLEGIERDLNDEELAKCIKKESIREELLQLLHDYNANCSNPRRESDFDSTRSTWGTASEHTDTGNSSQTFSVNSSFSEANSELFDDPQGVSETEININVTDDVDRNTQRKNKNINNSNVTNGNSDTLESTGTSQKDNPGPSSNTDNPGSSSKKAEKADFKKPQVPAPSPAKKTKTAKGQVGQSVAEKWRKSGFVVTVLDSHHDLVTAVDICNKLIISASRDTTVKIWDIDSLKEVRSLGGHTGTVTDVIVLSYTDIPTLGKSLGLKENDHLVLSSSTDCSLNLWSADTGELLSSIYTYNPITKIAFYKPTSLVAIASGGGKLELWNIITKETVSSEHAHSDSITGLCVSGNLIFTSCAVDGEIKVFEVRNNAIHCIFASENVRDSSGNTLHMRHVRSLSVKGDNLYYGDDGVNVKILSWKKGLVKKLANHKEEFGMTDSICCHGDVMMTSAYDLDNGQGYLNVFDVRTEPIYMATIDNSDTGRILDICCGESEAGVTIVTAGMDLQVWKQMTDISSKKHANKDEIAAAKFVPELSQFAQDSDLESEAEFSASESDDDSHSGRNSRRGSVQGSGWMSWCSIV